MIILFLGVLGTYFFFNTEVSKELIGARTTSMGTSNENSLFISVDGNGTTCSKEEPCNFMRLDLFSKNKLIPKPGTKVFFRKGTYYFSMDGAKRIYLAGGTKTKPISYENYNNEKVIFDGSKLGRNDSENEIWREGRLELRDDYSILRNVEVRNMPQYGIRILGNHNIVEGCKVYANALSGIEVFNYKDGYSTKATGGSFNILRDNIIFNNSDVHLKHHNYNDGGNADGITIHSGVGNLISHNTIYANSDDGIDTWQSMNSTIEFNLVYDNGQGNLGDGYGIKLGGAGKDSPLGANAVAKHNISYANRKSGFNVNRGKNVLIERNTAYRNGEYGYTLDDDTQVFNNLAFENTLGHFGWSNGLKQENNSWQIERPFEFKTVDNKSEDFLKLVGDETFVYVGAYGLEQKGQ